MSARRMLEVREEGRASQKWRVPLREEVFDSISQGQKTMNKVFGQGSLFSPLLFGKFFDPSDAFPLWDFDSEVLLSGPGNSTGNSVTWFATDTDYVLRAKLPGIIRNLAKPLSYSSLFPSPNPTLTRSIFFLAYNKQGLDEKEECPPLTSNTIIINLNN